MKTHYFIKKTYLPFLLLALATVISGILYTFISPKREALSYIKLISTALIPLLAPLSEDIFHIKIPIKLNALVAFHIFCAIHLGTCFSFYSRISWWDLFLHGFFGLVAAAIIFELMPTDMLRTRGSSVFAIFLTVASALGIGGLWEIFEFTTDAILGADAQCVEEAIKRGTNPIADTMTDLIITIVGSAVYLIFVIIFKKNKENNAERAKKS